MANFLDYIKWRGDLTFDVAPFNEIDNAIFAEASYLEFVSDSITYPSTHMMKFSKAVGQIFENKDIKDMSLGVLVPKTILEMGQAMKDSNRYKNIRVSNYINIIDKETRCQFSAVTFHLSDDEIYISFRGTDDTLMGWQENLDMLCIFPVPAQELAALYLNKVANLFKDTKIMLGGHSKGGNLSVYAGIYCDDEIKDRLKFISSNDGPGMVKSYVDKDKYNLVKHKIIKYIPEQCVVGLLLDNFAGKTIVVKSTNKGVFQHDGFSWVVDVNKFERVDSVSENAKKLDKAVTNMISNISDDEREKLSEDVYKFFMKVNNDTLSECQKDIFKLLRNINSLSFKHRKLFTELFIEFVRYKEI